MFKDFDWISPELLSSHLESSSDKSRQVPSQQQPNNTDNGASNLTEEIQDLRIRGYGDWFGKLLRIPKNKKKP